MAWAAVSTFRCKRKHFPGYGITRPRGRTEGGEGSPCLGSGNRGWVAWAVFRTTFRAPGGHGISSSLQDLPWLFLSPQQRAALSLSPPSGGKETLQFLLPSLVASFCRGDPGDLSPGGAALGCGCGWTAEELKSSVGDVVRLALRQRALQDPGVKRGSWRRSRWDKGRVRVLALILMKTPVLSASCVAVGP